MSRLSDVPTLREFQQQLGRLMLTMDGHQVLHDVAAFEAYTQPPEGRWLAGVSQERLFLYEELMTGCIHGVLSSVFSDTKRFFDKADFRHLAERYRRTHPNRSFQLFQAVAAFPQFLAESNLPAVERYPFLPTLAQVEYAEVQVKNAPYAEPVLGLSPQVPAALEAASSLCPVWNPAHTLLGCPYNIPAIIEVLRGLPDEGDLAALCDVEPSHTLLLLYRDSETDAVRQFVVTPLTALLMEQPDPSETFTAGFSRVSAQVPALQSMTPQALWQNALPTLQACQSAGILLGSIPLPVGR